MQTCCSMRFPMLCWGALALGDIGKHFPDTDPAYAGADSLKLLELVVEKVREQGYAVGNLDATVLCQKPKLAPYIGLHAGKDRSSMRRIRRAGSV